MWKEGACAVENEICSQQHQIIYLLLYRDRPERPVAACLLIYRVIYDGWDAAAGYSLLPQLDRLAAAAPPAVTISSHNRPCAHTHTLSHTGT